MPRYIWPNPLLADFFCCATSPSCSEMNMKLHTLRSHTLQKARVQVCTVVLCTLWAKLYRYNCNNNYEQYENKKNCFIPLLVIVIHVSTAVCNQPITAYNGTVINITDTFNYIRELVIANQVNQIDCASSHLRLKITDPCVYMLTNSL